MLCWVCRCDEWTVRKHGGSGEEAEGDGDWLRASGGRGRWDPSGSAVFPWPRWLHDWDMQLW